jgi:hypothetical protein
VGVCVGGATIFLVLVYMGPTVAALPPRIDTRVYLGDGMGIWGGNAMAAPPYDTGGTVITVVDVPLSCIEAGFSPGTTSENAHYVNQTPKV